ncbi:hypothetical protein BDR06DRAFT_1014562 [Suillus hirtellus]|nr:hypothetical protein BDR06DRAFT_1014562 [Suillus hirtellus]
MLSTPRHSQLWPPVEPQEPLDTPVDKKDKSKKKRKGIAKIWKLVRGNKENPQDHVSSQDLAQSQDTEQNEDDLPLVPPPPLSYLVEKDQESTWEAPPSLTYFLCRSMNTIMTQQKEVELFINTDEIVRDVNDAWDDADPMKPTMYFKGSDDYLQAKVALAYVEFLAKGKVNNVIITETGGDNSIDNFNPLWIAEFTKMNAYDMWQKSTDPMLFDIVEPNC